MSYTREYFDKQLDENDYFGFIPLSSQGLKNEIILEQRRANQHHKKKAMQDFAEREMDFVVHTSTNQKESKTIRLERALQKAFDW